MSTTATIPSTDSLAAALERGELVHFPVAPFPLPQGDELAFLFNQRPARFGHHDIGYDPATRRVSGFTRLGERDQPARLAEVFASFSQGATQWLDTILPGYKEGLKLDRVSYHPLEEATRRLRTSARNDLLHVDASPDHPTHGDRILRVFANINPTEPRVWITSDPFALLLQRYGREAGLPGDITPTMFARVKDGLRRMLPSRVSSQSAYDDFMHRFHGFLKRNDAFHMHCAKTVWHFQPGSIWMAMTDACSHAVLRGRFALEHSYLVSRENLVVPEESPRALLERFCKNVDDLRSAA